MLEALKQVQKTKETKSTEATTTNTAPTMAATGVAPSKFLPIRTARYWADVEAGKDVDIKFFKETGNSWEIHNNATNGFWKRVDKLSLQQVLRETAFELSLKGESDIATFFQNDKVVSVKIELLNKKYFPDGSLRYYHGLINLDTGIAPWIITKKFYYDDEGNVVVENAPRYETEDGEWEDISVEKFNKKFKQSIPNIVNLGKIPFPVITLTNTGADRWGSGTSDTAEVQDILLQLDKVYSAIDKAINVSRTRIFRKKKNGTMDLMQQSENGLVNQYLDQSVDVIDIVEDPHTDGDFQITDRSLNVQEWYQVKRDLEQQYYSHTGENVSSDAHGNNQHTYEVMSKGDNKYRRATSKRTQRQAEIKELIWIIVEMCREKGQNWMAGLNEVSVNIDEVDFRKEFEIEDRMEKLLDLGLVSKVQALMKIEGIDEPTAILLLSTKDKHDELFKEEEPEVVQPANQPVEPEPEQEGE